ncbi:MAG: glycosyltransferase [Actinomycetota bacterium]
MTEQNPASRGEPAAGRGGNGTSVAVYVCTHKRNGPLVDLLTSVNAAADNVQPDIAVAAVVVDDNPDGRAEPVVDGFEHTFALGLHYTHTGSQNISTARNRGVETAMGLADWVAMTDDDQTVSPMWLAELFAAQRTHDADAVTGPVFVQYGPDSPSWLGDQPFSELLEAQPRVDGEQVDTCSTGNSMILTSWLEAHPDIRFRKDLGVIGGEDMVFYRGAIQQGLRAFYALKAEAYQLQPPERSTYRHQLRSAYWLGNTSFLTGFEAGEAGRGRLAIRGTRKMVEAAISPVKRLVSGDPAHLRFAIAEAAFGAGMLAGTAGVKVPHP